MKLIKTVPTNIDPLFAKSHYESGLYQMSDNVLTHVKQRLRPGKTVVLFSGGHRFDLDAIFLEPKVYINVDLPWKPQTIFVDSGNATLTNYTIKKLYPDNLLILNTGIVTKYQPWQVLLQQIKNFQNFSGQVILTCPLVRIDFNRLKYSADQIANYMNGLVIDQTVIACQ